MKRQLIDGKNSRVVSIIMSSEHFQLHLYFIYSFLRALIVANVYHAVTLYENCRHFDTK